MTATADVRFDAVLGAGRRSGRARMETSDVLQAFVAGRATSSSQLRSAVRTDVEEKLCEARGNHQSTAPFGYCYLFDATGSLLARRRIVPDAHGVPAAAPSVSMSDDAAALRPRLLVLGVRTGPPKADETALLAALAHCPADRENLAGFGFDRGRLLDMLDAQLTDPEVMMLAALERCAEPLGSHRLADAGGVSEPHQTPSAWKRLRFDGLIENREEAYMWQLTADGHTLMTRRRALVRARTAPSEGRVRALLDRIRALALSTLRFSVVPGAGDSLGPGCVRRLRDAGLGSELDRAMLDLDELLIAQSFSPDSGSLRTLQYALMAALGDGVLSDRDIRSLWNAYYNLTREPFPA